MKSQTQKRPNILFIQVDQLFAGSLAAYGNRITKTPNLDRLAEGGAVFETAYCNFPLCAPSRFSMATGQLCSTIGAYDNAAEMGAEYPTYAHYLRALGYQTALSGKMHFVGPDQHHGFETRLTSDLYPADFSWVPNWANEGERDTNDPQSVLVSGICERSVQIDFDEEVTFRAKQHLFDMARNNDDRPFFLQVSYTHPHEPYLCTREFWDLYEGADIPLPDVPALSEADHDAHSVRVLKDFGMLDYTFQEADILRARRAHYGAISYVDRMVGEVLEVLRATGQVDNTHIIFTSDHGEFLGERGMWFKKHFFEPALRIPLLIAGPGIAPQRVREFASLVDLLPTFSGLATGGSWAGAVEPLEGTDLGRLFGTDQDPERAVFAEYLAEATTSPIFMIRQGRFKYITSRNDPPLLFDVDADPHERRNLAGDPSHSGIVQKLQAMADAKWDGPALTSAILSSQQRRALILQAHSNGTPPRWNHGEEPGEATRWYRGEQGYSDWAFDYLPEGVRPVPLT